MSIWKQCLLGIILLAVAAVLWVRYYPGAPGVLAAWGIDWVPVASASADNSGEKPAPERSASARAPGMVVTSPITNETINDRLTAIGTGRALSSVAVKPLSSGRLTVVVVQSGAQVEKGDVIARLDSDAEEIAVDRARLTLDNANAKLKRVRALRATNTVTEVQVTDAELEARNAELALREAQLALEHRSVIAPLAGVVGIVPVDTGEYVTSQTTIATIDDRSKILVDFWVPERFAGSVKVGMPLTASSVARPSDVFDGVVSAVDNRIDPESRTLHVQGRIVNPADRLRAGMAFEITMRFPGDTYPAVDPLAIQWGAEGAYVWAVKDGRAHRTDVRIIQRNTSSVLVDGDFSDGDLVVVQGVQNVRDGAEVMVAQQESAAGPLSAIPARGS
jgi:RND family efflux transporter MFP subunit